MTEETDMAGLVEHAGMVAVVNGIGVVVAAVGGYVVALAGFPDVTVYYDFAVNGYGDVVALNTDLFLAPLAQGLVLDALGGDDTVNGAVNLIFAQTGIHGCVMVQYLALAHALVGGIHAHGGTDAYAVVDTGAQEAELEAEDEVTVFLLGIEVALVAVVGGYVDASVDGHIAYLVAYEVVQVGTVEQQFEALRLLLV